MSFWKNHSMTFYHKSIKSWYIYTEQILIKKEKEEREKELTTHAYIYIYIYMCRNVKICRFYLFHFLDYQMDYYEV